MIADIIATDAQGRDVLIVEVKSRVWGAEFVPFYFERLAEAGPTIPYAMVVDPETIQVRHRSPDQLGDRSIVLATADVLRHYEPEFGSIRIFKDYLTALVEAWLRDLSFRWKGNDPPGLTALVAFGLIDHLAGGAVRREVPLGADVIR